jgi:hypothetical protein
MKGIWVMGYEKGESLCGEMIAPPGSAEMRKP